MPAIFLLLMFSHNKEHQEAGALPHLPVCHEVEILSPINQQSVLQ